MIALRHDEQAFTGTGCVAYQVVGSFDELYDGDKARLPDCGMGALGHDSCNFDTLRNVTQPFCILFACTCRNNNTRVAIPNVVGGRDRPAF